MPTKSRVRNTTNSSDGLIVTGKRKRIKPQLYSEESVPQKDDDNKSKSECPMEEQEPPKASRSKTKEANICPKCKKPFPTEARLKIHLSIKTPCNKRPPTSGPAVEDENALPFLTKTKLEKDKFSKQLCMRLGCTKLGVKEHPALLYGKLCAGCSNETKNENETQNDTDPRRFVGGLHGALLDNSGSKFKVAEGAHVANVGVGSVIGESISYNGYILHVIASINEGGGATRKEIYERIKQQQEHVLYYNVDQAMQQALDFNLITESGPSVSEYVPPPLVYDGVVDLPRAKKDPEAPKRAMSAYMCFFAANINAHSNLPRAERAQMVGAAWKGLSEEEKTEYIKESEDDKARYEKEKKDFQPQKDKQSRPREKITTIQVKKTTVASGTSKDKGSTVSAKKTGNSSPEVPSSQQQQQQAPPDNNNVDPEWNETCEAWLRRETSHKSNPTVDDILKRKCGYKLPLFRYKGGNPTIKSSWHPVILKKGPDRWSDTRDSIISYNDESLRREFGEHLRLVKKNTNDEIDMVDEDLHTVPITEEV